MDNEILNITGYQLFRADRISRSGGVALYVKHELKGKEKMAVSRNNIEILSVDIFVLNNKNIRIITVYRPPSSKLDECIDMLPEVLNTKIPNIVMGDFNYDFNSCVNQFHPITNLMSSLFLKPLINVPTRISSHRASILDQVFIPQNMCVEEIKMFDIYKCDHRVIDIEI